MAFEYKWSLTGLRKQNTSDLADVIVGTNWKVEATDEEGYTATFTGGTPFEVQDLNNDGFIDYKDLSEDLILGWVKSYVSGSDSPHPHYWQHVNEQLTKHIDTIKWEKQEVGPKNCPWSEASGSNIPDAPPV